MKNSISILVLFFLAAYAHAADLRLEQNKANVLGFYRLLAELEPRAAIEKYSGAYYRQHNPHVPDGKEGLVAYFDAGRENIPEGTPLPRANFVRLISEDDFVFVHRHVMLPVEAPDIVSMDLFRLEDGKIVEHWDAVQLVASKDTAKQMVSGPAQATDIGKTQTNKSLVRKFVENVFVQGNTLEFDDYFSKDSYIQHSSHISPRNNRSTRRYFKVHKLLAEGNFVFVQSEGQFDGEHSAFYDLFRVEDSKIAEHWDVIQAVPEKMAHDNGMF